MERTNDDFASKRLRIADPDRQGIDETPVAIATGVLTAAIFVHTFGLLAWGVMRGLMRKRAWTDTRSTYSPLVLGLVALTWLTLPASRTESEEPAGGNGTASAAELASSAPDPVGLKLIGASRQVSDADGTALEEH